VIVAQLPGNRMPAPGMSRGTPIRDALAADHQSEPEIGERRTRAGALI
jgi:hypothetical protein